MERILFFLVIAGILLTIYLMNVEGFQSGLNVPLAGPPVAQLPGNAKPYDPPSATLLAPPPGQIASVNSRPYEDPAMQKATIDRIRNVHATLKGFLTIEAPNIKQSDPSIQLPLSTARGDEARLNDELIVLQRNPGLPSSLTVEDLNGIEKNMGYLQKKWRLSPNVEGFECGCKFFSNLFSREGFQDTANVEPVPAEPKPEPQMNTSDSVTIDDLIDLSSRIAAEIVRLAASGTTDQLVQDRVNTLTTIKTKVDDMISQIQMGYKKISDVPLTKSDIATFLPIMSNLNSPVPQILNGTNPALQNLFQAYSGGDADGAKVAQEMFDKYIGYFLKNVSFDFNINYIGDAEQNIAKSEAAAFASLIGGPSYPGHFQHVVGGMGPNSEPIGLPNPSYVPYENRAPDEPSVDQPIADQPIADRMPIAPIAPIAPSATSAPGRPTQNTGSYDWKARATHICQQVSARGLNPGDYGCINPSSVSDGFSWRGNAKMVCTRLATLYDTSIPGASGCPPINWPGWRS